MTVQEMMLNSNNNLLLQDVTKNEPAEAVKNDADKIFSYMNMIAFNNKVDLKLC